MIELIVALAMVAIIAASLSSTLWTAYHATRQAEAAVVPSDQADVAMQFLSQDLQNALQTQTNPASELVGTPLTANNSEQTAFLGTQEQDSRGHPADDVVFFTTAESPVHVYANGEIKCVEYKVIQSLQSKEFVLVRRVTRNLLPVNGQNGATDEEVICTGVSSFSLEYSYDGTTFNPTSLTPIRGMPHSWTTPFPRPSRSRLNWKKRSPTAKCRPPLTPGSYCFRVRPLRSIPTSTPECQAYEPTRR